MSTVLTETVDAVRIITLNKPEIHNGVDDEMNHAIRAAIRDAVEDEEARAILIRGAGPSFSSGRDVRVLGKRAKGEHTYYFVKGHQDARMRLLDTGKPVVAAVQGAALGGGCELALAADIRVAATNLKMGLPEIHYGILPDTGGSQIMTTLIGPSRTKYMVLSGDPIDAQTALAWGAVDFVVELEELDKRAFEIARTLASRPPLALAMGKRMVDQMHMGAIRNGVHQELVSYCALYASEDYQENRAALREKRKPEYKGR